MWRREPTRSGRRARERRSDEPSGAWFHLVPPGTADGYPLGLRPKPRRLQLVAEPAQELLALLDVLVGLDAERRASVHHPEDGPALPLLGHDHLDGIRGGAVDPAHLLDHLHGVQHVDGETVS